MSRTTQPVVADPGSFRDPASRVFVGPEGVFRALSATGLEDWRALAASATFERFKASGGLIGTEECRAADLPAPVAEGAGAALTDGVAGVLRHERVPFVSYPYEWSFAMLRDAALLQLDLMLSALDDGLILKDASPYNVQWRGARPVFVDVGSFERLREGEPWAGYRQFCSLYLNPLLLQAYRGIPFQGLLRGSIDGISPAEADRYFSARDHLRRGILTHVHLHARLEARNAARAGGEAQREVREAGLQERADPRQRAPVAEARGAARLEPGVVRVERLPRCEHVHRRHRPCQGGVRRRGGALGGAGPGLGRRRKRRGVFTNRGGGRRARSSPSTATTPRSMRSTVRSPPRGPNRSCRWSPT